MDLNFLYARHQLGVMRSGDEASGPTRRQHLARARQAASEIVTYQLSQDAPAAAGWQRGIDDGDLNAAVEARLAR
jgi:hypothetical protein